MASNRGRDTRLELIIRKALHARGFRYRLHARELPGRPDLALPRYRAVVFVNGCFWHGHDCELFTLPATRTDFWETKFRRNRERDGAVRELLGAQGWRCVTLWECAIRGPGKRELEDVIDEVSGWLTRGSGDADVRGATRKREIAGQGRIAPGACVPRERS